MAQKLKFMRPSKLLRVGIGLVLLSLGGCATYDPFNLPFDARASDETKKAAEAPIGPVPQWSTAPVMPKDVPSAVQLKARVSTVETAEVDVFKGLNATLWDLDRVGVFRYTDNAKARMSPELSQPVPNGRYDEALSWAVKQKARAVAPPVEK